MTFCAFDRCLITDQSRNICCKSCDKIADCAVFCVRLKESEKCDYEVQHVDVQREV